MLAVIVSAVDPAWPCTLGDPPATAVADVPGPPLPLLDLEQTIRDWHEAGHSQWAIARELNIDRRKVKHALSVDAA